MLFQSPFYKTGPQFGDRIFSFLVKGASAFFIALFVGMILLLLFHAWPALSHFGFSFFTNPTWDSWKQEFGMLSLIYGTLVSSLLALLLAVPTSLALALFLNEIAGKYVSLILSFVVEMLAAIPSILYGLWGLFVLAPFLRNHIQPFLSLHFGENFLFFGPYYGIGMMCAGIILAIMILPTCTSLCREIFLATPHVNKEALLSLGATRWEMFKIVILRGGFSGILGAIALGFGRAFGETMAVTMVIGNKIGISPSLFAPSQTMASVLATQYAEADSRLQLSSLTAVALTLFIVSLFFNLLMIWFVSRIKKN